MCHHDSGLAVEAPPDKKGEATGGVDGIFAKATSMKSKDEIPSDSIKITYWKNGFTVNDGELRDGSTLEDKAFEKDVKNG